MPHHRYLIVGGGMTADAAVRGIRSLDPDGSIGLVGAEPDPPYDRPPLSKALWHDKPLEEIWRETGELDVELHLGRRIVRMDPLDDTVTDDRGVVYTYDRLLMATGGRPRELPDAPGQVVYFRTMADYRRLREASGPGRHFAVVGGGFIGSEIAAALAGTGARVTLLFPEVGIGARIFPESLARQLNAYYSEHGVDVRPGTTVASVRRSADGLLVATEGGPPPQDAAVPGAGTLRVNGVVAGLGIVPNQELAETAGLEVVDAEEGGGIVVDGRMRTSHERIWAAGDVAAVWCPPLGRRLRSEHEDQANTTGYHAGRAMAGSPDELDHLPFFYSDLFDLGYEAVGELDPRLDVVQDWQEPGRKGVVYYLRDGRVRGVLLWNVWGALDAARELIRSGEARPAASLRRAIPMD